MPQFKAKMKGVIIHLINKEEFKVGRKQADILINNDKSVSRLHSVLLLKDNKLILKDCGSKYGTFLNDTKANANEEVVLKHGNTIKFGIYGSTYDVEEIVIINVISNLTKTQKKDVTQNVAYLKGIISDVWRPDSTSVTVNQIVLTPKVLCALINGIPVVTLKYWDDFVANVKANLPPPQTKDYLPPYGEAILSARSLKWEYNPMRKTLFQNKVFIFLNENIKKQMQDLVAAAGGKAIFFFENPISVEDVQKSPLQHLLISDGKIPNDNNLKNIISHLKDEGKRLIPLQEIAVAIVMCSCEKDCNPDFNKTVELVGQKIQCISQNVLAPATQTQNTAVLEPSKPDVISASFDTDFANVKDEDGIDSGKNKCRDIDEVDCAPTKQIKLLENTDVHSSENKPKVPDVNPFLQLKSKIQQSKQQSSNTSKSKPGDITLFMKKRKSEQLQTENVEIQQSDCASKTQEIKEENPFLNTLKRIKIEKSTSRKESISMDSHNLEQITARPSTTRFNDVNIASSTLTTQGAKAFEVFDISCISIKAEKDTDHNWIDTKSELNDSKSTIVVNDHDDEKAEKTDPEIKKFIDMFKNAWVIKEVDLITIRKDNTSISDSVMNKTGSNFKKFKKVLPKKPQRTIISTTGLTKVECVI